MTGLETAELLCEQGNKVAVVEMADTLAPGTWMQHPDDVLPRLKAAGAEFFTSSKLVKINENGVELENTKNGNIHTEQADNVVLALGVRPVNGLKDDAASICDRVFLIGDAFKTGRIAHATRSAYEAALKI